MEMDCVALNELDGVKAISLSEAPEAWEALIESRSSVPCEYVPSMVAYQTAYMEEHSDSLKALNAIIYYDDKPIALWPLNIYQREGVWAIGSNAVPVLPPLLVDSISPKLEKLVSRYALAQLTHICEQIGLTEWQGSEILRNGKSSNWHKMIMETGASIKVHHELFVDLERDLSVIKSNFRRRYKTLINKAATLWRCQIVNENIGQAFEDFRALHIHVAGRETRSKKTWNLQKYAVENGDGFIVFLKDQENKLIGAALIMHSQTEAVYSVGAYDRSYFEKPIGHLVQMTAISHMKELGIKWYHLGYRPYPGDQPVPDEKEIQIGFFKEGFASHSCLNVLTKSPILSAK